MMMLMMLMRIQNKKLATGNRESSPGGDSTHERTEKETNGTLVHTLGLGSLKLK
jgi:hypothetical protein